MDELTDLKSGDETTNKSQYCFILCPSQKQLQKQKPHSVIVPSKFVNKNYLFNIFTVKSCPRFHPYNNSTSVLSQLTSELVECFESCNRKRTCKGMSVSKESPPQCTMFVGEFPPQLGSLDDVWIKGLLLQIQIKR